MAKTEMPPGRVRGEGQAPAPGIRIASTLELPAVNVIIDRAMATCDPVDDSDYAYRY